MKSLRNQSGQMILESILIMTILMGITVLTTRYMKSNEVVAGLISAPWVKLSGMLQNGVWLPPKAGAPLHPNHSKRAASLAGEDPR